MMGLSLLLALLPACAALVQRTGPKNPLEGAGWWTAHQREAYRSDPGQAATVENAKPLAWVHVPKAGSSMVNAVVHVPGVCPRVPASVVIDEKHFGSACLKGFWSQYPLHEYCPTGLVPKYRSSHIGMDTHAYDTTIKGHSVIMLRQPEQRLISAQFNSYHSWPLDEHDGRLPMDIYEYASAVEGCSVKMLTRPGGAYESHTHFPYGVAESIAMNTHWGGPCGSGPAPSADEVALAKTRLREGFVFVGLTDDWEMSMCLFHTMFGFSCQATDFEDSRTDNGKAHEPYPAESIAPGYHDPYDGELYKEAKAILKEKLGLYGLTPTTCKPCFDEAGITYSGF